MKHPKIIAEIERTHWAITQPALEGLLRAAERELTAEDYKLFHQIERERREALVADLGERMPDTRNVHIRGQTGIMFVDGPIIPRASAITDASGLVSIDGLSKDFQALEKDDSIHQILMLFDSPGGSVTGVSDFAQMIAASSKLVTSFVFGQALSAAYWIAAASDQIVSTDTGLAGSIGVVLTQRRNVDGEEKREFISSQSPLKHASPDTKEGKASLQRVADDLGDVFVSAVAQNRDISKDKVLKDFGQGASVVAARALEAGMIDSIQSLDGFLSSSAGSAAGTKRRRPQAAASAEIDTEERQDSNSHPPAVAGTKGGQQMLMTLKEACAENPAIAAEFEKAIEAAEAKGFEAGLVKAQARIEAASPFLKPESPYGEAGNNLALQVLAGKADAAALQAVATVLDAQKEREANAAAQEETEEQEDTPAEPPLTAEGTEHANFDADVAAYRAHRGLEV